MVQHGVSHLQFFRAEEEEEEEGNDFFLVISSFSCVVDVKFPVMSNFTAMTAIEVEWLLSCCFFKLG